MIAFLLNLKLSWVVISNYILRTGRIYLLIILFCTILFSLQWLFNIDQLISIIFRDNGLSIGDKIGFLADGFVNIFRYSDNIVPLSMITIAFIQSVSLTLLLSFKNIKKLRSNQSLPLGLGFIGIGCVACGGSILTPILGILASNASVLLAESISSILLVTAIIFSYVSMNKITHIIAQVAPQVR